jgi:tRNA pseudouridine55 synthase
VTCSSGTYVRAIARDLGRALGVGGHLTRLRRTSVGPFSLDEAHTLDDLARDLALVGFDRIAERCFPTYRLDEHQALEVGFGRGLDVDLGAPGPVALLDAAGRFLALYEQREAVARPVAVFSGQG